jgi:hypothetical protein
MSLPSSQIQVALRELRRRVPTSVEVWEGTVAVGAGVASLTTSGGRAFGKVDVVSR